MQQATLGLQGHIWSNNLKSLLLLAGFPFLLLLMLFCFFAIGGHAESATQAVDPFSAGIEGIRHYGHWALIAASMWFAIAFMFHQFMINLSTGAHSMSRKDNPEIYNLLENLCISRGMTMPKLFVIESPALNAYASGISEKTYAVTLTRGLIQTLNREELEAVIAHELSHIRNRDVRLLIISVIFVGMISFLSEMVWRSMRYGRMSFGRGRNGKGQGLALLVAGLILAVGYFFAIVIRFALSRSREYLADAGAVELTKNPTALISALRKISRNPNVEGTPAEVQQMFIESTTSFMGMFATHPPMDKRIAALVGLGGVDTVLRDDAPQTGIGEGPWSALEKADDKGPWQ